MKQEAQTVVPDPLTEIRRIGFLETSERDRFDRLLDGLDPKHLPIIAPILTYWTLRRRRGPRLTDLVMIYIDIVAECGSLEAFTPLFLSGLGDEEGNLKQSRFNLLIDLLMAHKRATDPKQFPNWVRQRGVADPLGLELRKFFDAALRLAPSDSRVALEPLTEEQVDTIIHGVSSRIAEQEVDLCRIIIRVFNHNGGRWPGLSTIRLKEVSLDASGLPAMLLVELPGSHEKYRAHFRLDAAGAQELQEMLERRRIAEGYASVKKLLEDQPEALLFPDPRSVDVLPLQTNTLVSWFDLLGTAFLKRPLCRRHFRITSFTRDVANGAPLEILQMTKGQSDDGRATMAYVRLRIPHLHTQRERMGGGQIVLPLCHHCEKPHLELAKPCPHCGRFAVKTADADEFRLAAVVRNGQKSHQIRSLLRST